MRISDWSSDVCSSDLRRRVSGLGRGEERVLTHQRGDVRHRIAQRNDEARVGEQRDQSSQASEVIVVLREIATPLPQPQELADELGRASCRERVCQYV